MLSGAELDDLGNAFGLHRKPNENDQCFGSRISSMLRGEEPHAGLRAGVGRVLERFYNHKMSAATLKAVELQLVAELRKELPAGSNDVEIKLHPQSDGTVQAEIKWPHETIHVPPTLEEQIRHMAHAGRKATIVNTSSDRVTVRELGLDLAPGEEAEVDEVYTIPYRGDKRGLINMLAPQLVCARVTCPTCETVIGQRSATDEHVEWEHKAPCGMPCAGLAQMHHDGRHNGDGHGQCPRCEPKPCPACRGTGQGPEQAARHLGANIWVNGAEHEKCSRCHGSRYVKGRELW